MGGRPPLLEFPVETEVSWSVSKNISIDETFAQLHECITNGDEHCVQDVIFSLGGLNNNWEVVSDEVVERLLTLLRTKEMYESPVAGHALNYFEFESPRLSPRQKSLCIGFLKAHGDQFVNVHSRQVVTELRYGSYLK
jgi:hypothetical protein